MDSCPLILRYPRFPWIFIVRIKNDRKLAELLSASEARGRGEHPAASGGHDWQSVSLEALRGGKGGAAPAIAQRRRLQLRIIGIDTALRKTGWGVIEVAGNTIRAVDCGVVVNPATAPVTECLRHLNQAVHGLIGVYKPDEAAIEGGFYCRNARTAIVLGTARGAVLAELAAACLPVYEYAPRRAKQCVTGKGSAAKEQVAAMVSNILDIRVDNLANDSTDALALAICHASSLMNPAASPEKPI